MELKQAKRYQARIKMALQGPSGSGKTMGALLIAFGLTGDWGRVAVIDTENHSASLYAHLGSYNVLNLEPPFTPERYISALNFCENAGMEAIIIDSISHEWEGAGGVLDSHSQMVGNSFTNWGKLTPRHNAFVQRMLQTKAHIISTIRTKQEYVIAEKNGKMVPEKVGLKGITRDGMDYEFTLVFDLQNNGMGVASKDRTGLFAKNGVIGLNEAVGSTIKAWCMEGEMVDEIEEFRSLIQRTQSQAALRVLYDQNPRFQQLLKGDFTSRKAELLQTQMM